MSLYDDLGVAPDATPEQLTAAYRRLSKQHHPDAGGDAEAFARVTHAASILRDPARRAQYDATGREDFREAAPDAAAARLRGDIPQLPAVVVQYASAADEAASFVHLNQQRRPLTRLDLFKAARVIGPGETDDQAILCPAQTGATDCCATCALCWASTRTIAFRRH